MSIQARTTVVAPPASILMIDDDPASISMLAEVLASAGYRLVMVTTGREALASVAYEA